MSMTARQISIIQSSFAKVEPIADQAAEIFYDKLFEYDPSLRSLFESNMKDQGQKLMTVLKVAVGSLNDLEGLVPTLQNLAKAHIKYGIEAEDYTPVGNALIYALQQGLGPAFTPELRKAWTDLYRLVATVMRQAAYPGFNPRTFKNKRHYNR